MTLRQWINSLDPLTSVRVGKDTLNAYEWLRRLTYSVNHEIYWLDLTTTNFNAKYNDDYERWEVVIWPDD